MKQLIIGGARSGKSGFAQQQAFATGLPVTYIATAFNDANDVEMQARIQRHRMDRPAHWRTIETGEALSESLVAVDAPNTVLLVDCLTLWLAQCLWSPQHELRTAFWSQQRDALLNCLPTLQAELLLVSNEVGLGVMPDNAAARRFADEQGWLNQQVARSCDRVTLMTAGLPLRLKDAT